MIGRTLPFSFQGYFLFVLFALLLICVSCGNNLDGFTSTSAASTTAPSTVATDSSDPGISASDSSDVKEAKKRSCECREHGIPDFQSDALKLIAKSSIRVSSVIVVGDTRRVIALPTPVDLDLLDFGNAVSQLVSVLDLPSGKIVGFFLNVDSTQIVLKNETLWAPRLTASDKLSILGSYVSIGLLSRLNSTGGPTAIKLKLEAECNLILRGSNNACHSNQLRGFVLVPTFFARLN